ncbi:MAG: Hpt domain-containing protein [Gemmatimonadota bacterium]
MTAPGGLLDFFTLEAAEHLDRLDALVSAGGEPDADGLHRHARALRGAAMMARVPVVAELAGALERATRAVRDGGMPWGAGQRSALVSTVDELRRLVRTSAGLTTADEARARSLAAELDAFAPGARAATPPLAGGSATAGILAIEARALQVAIAMVRGRPDDPAALGPLTDRVHRLRGIAALREHPAIADLVEGIARAMRPAERGDRLDDAAMQVLVAAEDVLADAAPTLEAQQPLPAGAPSLARFGAAVAALDRRQGADDRIVPIADLYHGDNGPHVISASPAPPTTSAQRFRLEVVSQAEHLRRLIADARVARDPAARDRAARELRRGMRDLAQVAASFREDAVSAFLNRRIEGAARLESAALAAVDAAATALADPRASSDTVARRLRDAALTPAEVPVVARRTPTPALATRSVTPPASPAAVPQRRPTPPTMTPGLAATPPRVAAAAAPATPLQALVAQGLAGLDALATTPLVPPSDIADDSIVPIERLVYRGRAALARALEVREAIRRRGDATSDELAELFDLLELVGAE